MPFFVVCRNLNRKILGDFLMFISSVVLDERKLPPSRADRTVTRPLSKLAQVVPPLSSQSLGTW